MTNELIIMQESIKLMNDGILGTTGREIIVDFGPGLGMIKTMEPEPIHTFAIWKELGYSVKKGEHAKAKITIWKHVAGKTAEDSENADADGEEAADKGERMFRKTAYFFTREQVQEITARQ